MSTTMPRTEWERQQLRGDGFFIPIKVDSLANQREHWAIKSKRAKSQRTAAKVLLLLHHGEIPPLPLSVTFTRYGPRALDDDNLAISFKHIRDGVADAIGVDDGDERYRWNYRQEHAKFYGIRIEFSQG